MFILFLFHMYEKKTIRMILKKTHFTKKLSFLNSVFQLHIKILDESKPYI